MKHILLFLLLPFMAIQANTVIPETLTAIDRFFEESWYDIDFFIVLSDDSYWLLEKAEEEACQWVKGDIIHVMKDTSFCFFPSEYSFQLYNHTLEQTANVQLINFGENPLTIVDDHEWEATDYKKQVTLSNGTTWEIEASLDRFRPGKKVYIGYNEYEEKYFLITRICKNSVWSWAKKN